MRMRCRRQVGGGEMADASFHEGLGVDAQGQPGLVGEGDPAHVGMVAMFLGHDVGVVLLAHAAGVDADCRASLAVDVIFVRATAVPAKTVESGGYVRVRPMRGRSGSPAAQRTSFSNRIWPSPVMIIIC